MTRSARIDWTLMVIAVLTLLWTFLGAAQAPMPEPPPPASPCQENPAEACVVVTMVIEGELRMFTADDLGRPLDALDETTVCTGRWTRGAFRYFADGTAPSPLVGTLVPYPPSARDENGQVVPPTDPEHTLEDSGEVIRLYNRAQVRSFKAVWANWGGGDVSWECQL